MSLLLEKLKPYAHLFAIVKEAPRLRPRPLSDDEPIKFPKRINAIWQRACEVVDEILAIIIASDAGVLMERGDV